MKVIFSIYYSIKFMKSLELSVATDSSPNPCELECKYVYTSESCSKISSDIWNFGIILDKNIHLVEHKKKNLGIGNRKFH